MLLMMSDFVLRETLRRFMNIETILYLADILNKVQMLFLFTPLLYFILFGFVTLVIATGPASSYSEDKILREKFKNKVLGNYKKIFILPLSIILISCIIPSQRTIYLMLGAHYIKNSTLPTKVELAIEKKIDSYLNDGE
jgi:hypothetical protein